MGWKRKKLLLTMVMAFLLASLLQNNVFTASGQELKPEFVAALENIPTQISEIKHKLSFNEVPTPTPSPTFTVFPTGQIYVGPSVIVQPTQIIYPTQAPTPPLVADAPPVFSTPTLIPLPTIIYNTPTPIPTQIPPTNSPPPTVIYNTPTPPSQSNSTMADFGKCLTQKGMILYIINNCPSCGEQKQLLGEAFKYVTTVNCSVNGRTCYEAGVHGGMPNWGKNGRIVIPGGASLDYLAQVSGCQLPN